MVVSSEALELSGKPVDWNNSDIRFAVLFQDNLGEPVSEMIKATHCQHYALSALCWTSQDTLGVELIRHINPYCCHCLCDSLVYACCNFLSSDFSYLHQLPPFDRLLQKTANKNDTPSHCMLHHCRNCRGYTQQWWWQSNPSMVIIQAHGV